MTCGNVPRIVQGAQSPVESKGKRGGVEIMNDPG